MAIDPVLNLKNVLRNVVINYSKLNFKQRSPTAEYSYEEWLSVIDELDQIFEIFYPQALENVEMAFSRDQQVITGYFDEIKSLAYEKKQSNDYDYLLLLIVAYLSTQSQENWIEILRPILLASMIAVGLNWARHLNIETSSDILSVYISASDWFNSYILKFAQEVSSTTERAVSGILQEGAERGWGIDRIKNQINFLFEKWLSDIDPTDPDYQWLLDRTPLYRSRMIARTEINRAMNASSHRQFQNWNVTYHIWFTELDERVRDSHDDTHGQIQLLSVPFTTGLGNKLMYPLDPSGPPEDVINCRCSEIPAYSVNEAERIAQRHVG